MDKPYVSVLIATYKRAHLLNYVLGALTNQTYRNFEVLIILKPSGDGTEDVVKKYNRSLRIKLILQTKEGILDALNLGLENVCGDIIAFCDDDAIPFPDWIETYVETYTLPNVGGVAGNVIPVLMAGERVILTKGKSSEIIPEIEPFMPTIARKLWSCPLEGLEDYLVYISKAGIVDYNFEIANRANHQITNSLLGMGTNMSILSKAVEDFKFPNSAIRGLSNEQLLGWYVWRKGYSLLFNPKIKVYHIQHGQSLSRNIKEARKETLGWTENTLLFYRLYDLEPSLSKMHRLTWLIFDTIDDIKKICVDREIFRVNRITSKFYSESIGLKWLLSKKLGSGCFPIEDLRKLE